MLVNEKGLAATRAKKFNLFLFLIFGSNIRARLVRRTPPAAGWFDGVASDSNRLLSRATEPQLLGPHFGIRQVLDQPEAIESSGIERNSFIGLWERVVPENPSRPSSRVNHDCTSQ